jgi:regulatory protein
MARADRADSLEECRARAVRLLTVRARSREELRRSLELRGFDAATIARTLEALAGDGSLDEQAALESFLMGRETRFSRERLRGEMLRRGFPKVSIDRALAAISEDHEKALLESLCRRRSAELANLPPEKRKKKVFDFLRRRGFPPPAIFEAMGEPEEG